jgi:phosphopantetheinyl transferase
MDLQSRHHGSGGADSRIRDMFAARARVWALAARDDLHVLYAPFQSAAWVNSLCSEALSNDELLQAGRFAAAEDKALFIQRRAFRRYCGNLALGAQRRLAQIHFAATAAGRPFLAGRPDIWFSFSSCRRGMLAAWSSSHAMGVDIEDQARALDTVQIAEMFFAPSEAGLVRFARGAEQRRRFFRLWCLKEAALKSIGQGLPFGLDSFAFDLEPQLCVARAPLVRGRAVEFSADVIEEREWCAAVVTRKLGERGHELDGCELQTLARRS